MRIFHSHLVLLMIVNNALLIRMKFLRDLLNKLKNVVFSNDIWATK